MMIPFHTGYFIINAPPTSDSHQFAYRAQGATEDVVAISLLLSLWTDLEHPVRYVKMFLLFIDYSS